MRRLSIELPESLHQRIKAQASLEGITMRAYVLRQLGWPDEPASRHVRPSPQRQADEAPEPGSMRELIENRPWRGEKTKAEIDARIAEERAGWYER